VDVDLGEKPTHTVSPDGTEEWCLNGELHRDDGPAVVWLDGREEWWLNGKRVVPPHEEEAR
jgi:hypothetical protein